MTVDEFAALLASGYERRGMECKVAGSRKTRHYLARVAKAAMAMSNRRDGGIVVLGVEDTGQDLVPRGLSSDELQTWRRYDDVAASLREFSEPSLSFDLEVLDYHGLSVVILHIQEFADYPTLCLADYTHQTTGQKNQDLILRRGAVYVRSRTKPESTEVPSLEEMRELVDLAVEKGVRRFLERAYRAGIDIAAASAGASTDAALFDRQLGIDI